MPNKIITIETVVNAPVAKVWASWTLPEHITHWAFATPDWEAPTASNDVRVGGSFSTRMQAKDGSAGFDFGGTYTAVEAEKLLEYTIGDGRKVSIEFTTTPAGTRVVESFDMEEINSEERQRGGWQAILDNFKTYAENNN